MLFAVGCAGGDGGPGSGADVAPAKSAVFVSLSTDFESEQWDAADALVDKFPGGAGFVRLLLSNLEEEDVDFERDVKPALGPEVDFVILEFPEDGEDPDVVVLTQPEDEGKLDALLEKGDEPAVKREVEEWTAIAETQAILDRFVRASEGDSLADSEAFKDAMEDLPDDAMVKGYIRGDSLRQALAAEPGLGGGQLEQVLPGGGVPSVGFTVAAEEDGVRVEAGGRAEGELPATYEAAFASELPAGALAYFSFNDLAKSARQAIRQAGDTQEGFDRQLAQVELALGLSIQDDVLPLFENEGALAVYPGAESPLAANQPAALPTVTLLLGVEDEQKAMRTLDRLAERARQFAPQVEVRETEIGGVTAKEVALGAQGTVLYAAFEGKLVVTTTEDGIVGLRDEGEKLADDPVFAQAREATDMPEETAGFMYLNLEDGVPFVTGLAEEQGEEVPPQVAENLEPLRSLLVFGSVEDERFRLAGFLGIR